MEGTAIERPQPRLSTGEGLPAYDPRELAAYRQAHAITADDLAKQLRTQRTTIARYERGSAGPLEARYGDRLLGGIEAIARNRARLAAEGLVALEQIRATGVPAQRRGRPRPVEQITGASTTTGATR